MREGAAVPRPIYTDPEIAGVGLTEAQAVEQYGVENVAVGRFPWVANARAVMTGETAGWVKSIHETTYGELVGVVIVGQHATDLIEAAVVALDPQGTNEKGGGGRRGLSRRADHRDGCGRHGTAPDAVRGNQGGRARGARPSDPPAAAPQ